MYAGNRANWNRSIFAFGSAAPAAYKDTARTMPKEKQHHDGTTACPLGEVSCKSYTVLNLHRNRYINQRNPLARGMASDRLHFMRHSCLRSGTILISYPVLPYLFVTSTTHALAFPPCHAEI
jgi:hypothetical protein